MRLRHLAVDLRRFASRFARCVLRIAPAEVSPQGSLCAVLGLLVTAGIVPPVCFADSVDSTRLATSQDAHSCTPDPAADCLLTPAAYQDAWRQHTVACVDPSLYTTIPWDYQPDVGSGIGETHLYPEEFAYAWAGGHRNLETFLEIRCRYQENPAKVRVGIESYVGFPVPVRNRDSRAAAQPLPMFIYTLDAVVPDEPSQIARVTVPSFSAWVHILDQDFGLKFELEAQQEVVMRYASLSAFVRKRSRKQLDPVRAFTQLTGCKRSRDWQMVPGFPPTESQRGCSSSYRLARAAAGGLKVGPGGPRTRECFEKFAADPTAPRDGTALRAVLELCQDASALNTGVGLGYNAMPHPLVCKRWARQTVAEKITGPEFILPNGTLKTGELGRGWVVVNLEALEDARYDLRQGYCR